MSVVLAATIACSVAVLGMAAVSAGSYTWRRTTAARHAAVLEQLRRHGSAPPKPFSSADLAGLPDPVARYFAFALPEGQRRIRAAKIQWTGEMRLQPKAPWKPYTAAQLFTASPPGIVWDADFKMMPLLSVRVRDSYIGGVGSMLARIGGLVSMVDVSGTREMAQGSLVRWLGEAVWFPTALLPGEGVRWEPIDASSARATVTDGDLSVSADFHFAPSGEPLRCTAMRYRDVNGKGVLTPFEGTYQRCTRENGVMVPSAAEVAWTLPEEGRFAYWRGSPTTVEFDLGDEAKA